MNYKITVVIPTYNVEKFIKRSVDSVMNQTIGFENIELIMVDNSSTDSTKRILMEYSQQYDNIKCFYPKGNSGTPCRGRNIGIDNASSDYIMFLDADDKYADNLCEVLYNTLIDENADVVSCRPIIHKDNEIYKEKTFLDSEKDFLKITDIKQYPKIMSSGVTMLVWNKIFKKELLNKYNIRFPEKDLNEDVYFSTKYYLNAKCIVLLNNFWGYEYHIRTEGDNKSISRDHIEENLIKQINGLKKIFELLKHSNAHYPVLECEMLVGITKLFIFTNPPNNKKRKLLKQINDLYKRYKWNVRLVNVSLPLNIIINIFMKIFSSNITVAVFITNFINFLLRGISIN